MTSKIACKDCKHWGLKRTFLFVSETHVSDEFVTAATAQELQAQRDCKVPVWPANEWIDWDGMRMCQHPSCFEYQKTFDPIAGNIRESVRVAGQAQHNPEGSCHLYKKKWWKFWAADRAKQ